MTDESNETGRCAMQATETDARWRVSISTRALQMARRQADEAVGQAKLALGTRECERDGLVRRLAEVQAQVDSARRELDRRTLHRRELDDVAPQ